MESADPWPSGIDGAISINAVANIMIALSAEVETIRAP